MPRTAKYLIVVVSALLMLVLTLRWQSRRSAGDAALVPWGSGELSVSEGAYYSDRISEIIHMWIRMGQRAERDEEERPREPYDTFLVLDPGRHEIWIEDRGQVLEESRSELPARMTWAVYYDGGKGANLLSEVVRLRYRGSDYTRHYPEVMHLAGQTTKQYLAFKISDHSLGISRSRDGGPFKPSVHLAPQKQGVRYYNSILVSSAEYEQARLSRASASQETTSSRQLLKTTADENKAAWASVRKRLYQAIEGQVNRTGYHLRQLQVRPGPDYSAAHAQMQVARDGIVPNLLRRNVPLDPYLLIDYLGNDIWYAKIVPNPRPPTSGRNSLDPTKELPLEFLISADRTVPSSDRRARIEKGRETQRQRTSAQTRWTARLANGAAVTFLGVCEHPSGGKQWWGPDGSPIDYGPQVLHDPDDPRVNVRRGFEFAWRVQHPDLDKPQGLSVRHRVDGGSCFSTNQCCDHYGIVLPDGHYECYTFGRSQEKTTLTIDTNLNNESPCTVKFKNISLVPDRNQGFEIEVVK